MFKRPVPRENVPTGSNAAHYLANIWNTFTMQGTKKEQNVQNKQIWSMPKTKKFPYEVSSWCREKLGEELFLRSVDLLVCKVSRARSQCMVGDPGVVPVCKNLGAPSRPRIWCSTRGCSGAAPSTRGGAQPQKRLLLFTGHGRLHCISHIQWRFIFIKKNVHNQKLVGNDKHSLKLCFDLPFPEDKVLEGIEWRRQKRQRLRSI